MALKLIVFAIILGIFAFVVYMSADKIGSAVYKTIKFLRTEKEDKNE